MSCISRFKTSVKQKVSVSALDFKVLRQYQPNNDALLKILNKYQPINDGSGKFDPKNIINNAKIFVCYLFLENIITALHKALHKRMQSTKE